MSVVTNYQTTGVVDPSSVSGGGSGSFSPLSRLTPRNTRQTVQVELPTPAAGTEVTLATLTGSGIIKMLQMTCSRGTVAKDGRIRVYVDGEATPSIDADLGTLLLTALSATTASDSYGTDHMVVSIPSDTTGTYAAFKAMSGGIMFPIPYGNGCRVAFYVPTGVDIGSGGAVYSQIAYEPGASSSLRLRSVGVTQLNKASVGQNQQVTFCDVPNVAGWLVWLSIAASSGSSSVGYLERQEWVAVDGEDITPDGSGAIKPSFSTSGGEDLFLNGWYFSGLTKVKNPWVVVTSTNNASGDTVAGIDLLGLYGGIKFASRLQAGWSLKDGTGNQWLVPFTLSHCLLYYVDTSVPFAPTAPRNVTSSSTGATSGSVSWEAPASAGSAPVSGYTVTLSPGGATQTVGGGTFTAPFTGLTTGVTYTPTVVATNSVGNSSGATGPTFMPTAAAVPTAPTAVVVAKGDTTILVNFTAPSSDGGSAITGYTAVASPSGLTGTVSGAAAAPITISGLTNGVAQTVTVYATNANGNGPASSASASVTPSAAAITDTFTRADAATLGTTTTGGKTWSLSQTAGTNTGNIVSNTAWQQGGGGVSGVLFATVAGADSSFDISLKIGTLGANPNFSGLIARYVDTNNLLVLQTGSTANSPTVYQLQKKVSGTNTTVGTINKVPANGDIIRMSAAAGSAQVNVWINGVYYGPFDATGVNTTGVNVGWQQATATSGTVQSTVRVDDFIAY